MSAVNDAADALSSGFLYEFQDHIDVVSYWWGRRARPRLSCRRIDREMLMHQHRARTERLRGDIFEECPDNRPLGYPLACHISRLLQCIANHTAAVRGA